MWPELNWHAHQYKLSWASYRLRWLCCSTSIATQGVPGGSYPLCGEPVSACAVSWTPLGDSCAFCYAQDLNKVYGTPRGIRALRTGLRP